MKLTVDALESEKWSFPAHWTQSDKHRFIDEAIEYFEQQEMYEQCAKLYEIKKTL